MSPSAREYCVPSSTHLAFWIGTLGTLGLGAVFVAALWIRGAYDVAAIAAAIYGLYTAVIAIPSANLTRRVRIAEETFEFERVVGGTIRQRLSDLVDVRMLPRDIMRRGHPRLDLTFHDGTVVRISGLVVGFDEMVKHIASMAATRRNAPH